MGLYLTVIFKWMLQLSLISLPISIKIFDIIFFVNIPSKIWLYEFRFLNLNCNYFNLIFTYINLNLKCFWHNILFLFKIIFFAILFIFWVFIFCI